MLMECDHIESGRWIDTYMLQCYTKRFTDGEPSLKLRFRI